MATFPIVDLSDDDHDLARIHALADALGESRDAHPGFLLDQAIVRLRNAEFAAESDAPDEDETDSVYARALDALADALGVMAGTASPAYLITKAAGRLRADDEADARWIAASSALADALGMERDNSPVHLLEAAAAQLAPSIEVGSLIQGHVLPDLPDGVRYAEADETGSPVEYGVVLQVRPGYVPGVVEPHRFYVIVSVPGA